MTAEQKWQEALEEAIVIVGAYQYLCNMEPVIKALLARERRGAEAEREACAALRDTFDADKSQAYQMVAKMSSHGAFKLGYNRALHDYADTIQARGKDDNG